MEKKTVPDLALPLGGGARSPFESSDSAALAGYEPVRYSIDVSVLSRIRLALDAAEDNAGELLQLHDQQLGRTTKKNVRIAEMYEQEIAEIKCLLGLIPDDLGS